MKHTIKYLMAVVMLSAAALFSACQKDETNSTVTLTAIADDAATGSKAYVYNNYLCWHNTDDVKVNNVEHTITASTSGGETSAKASITDVGYNENGYVAAYPASSVKTMGAGVDGKVTISVPVTQTYTTLTTASGTTAQVVPMPMVGRCASADELLKFHNAAALVKVTVLGEGMQVYKIVVSTTDGVLSGSAEMSAGDEEENKVLVPTSETGNSVTLDCSESLPGPGDFYLVVAPFENKAVTVTVWAKDASSQKYAITKTSQREGGLTIGRNQIGPIPITIGTDADKVNFWGSGDEDDPYLITDQTDLSNFIGQTSGCFKQTADIDYGESDFINPYTFSGHYDGGGHIIRFKLSTTGLVTKLGNGAFIENLTLKGNDVGNSVDKWGAFCCEISTSATVTLKNCTNEINCTSSGSNGGLGGLIGYASNNSIELTLENCSNKANISGKSFVGGVMGRALVKKIEMTGCSNEGDVTCVYGTSACVGGLVSLAALQNGNSENIIDLDRCVNSGAVTMDVANASMGACGGVIGCLNEKNSNIVTITNCANKANVSATGNIQCMGGIVGKLQAPTSSPACTCNIFNSYSTGNLSSSGTVTAKTGGMGGIMAILTHATTEYFYKIEINNCYFSGSLSATGGMTHYSGIASMKDENIKCENCYSVNNCTGAGKAADIVITPITNKETLRGNLNSIAESSGWSSWKKVGDTYPVFSWE